MGVSKSFFVAIAAGASFSSSASGQPARSDIVGSAEALLKEGKADQSLALVDPIIAQAMLKDAKDPKAICPGDAVAVLERFMKDKVSISVENDWCEAMLVKGYALNELKRPAEAALVLESLVGHAPNNPQYLIEYAYIRSVRTACWNARSTSISGPRSSHPSLKTVEAQPIGRQRRFVDRDMLTLTFNSGTPLRLRINEASNMSPITILRTVNSGTSINIVRTNAG